MSEIIATENKINLMKKAIVTQSNRFIWASYDMSANELKLFYWIISKLNSQKDSLFEICEIPVSEIMRIWEHNPEAHPNYSYIESICKSMVNKTFIEKYEVIDESTQKKQKVFEGFSIFKRMRYIEGQARVEYEFNDALLEHLLQLTKNFTSFKWHYIQPMKSQYGIRIYNILCSEIRQNRTKTIIDLKRLQGILGVSKSLTRDFFNFKQKVLIPAQKDINCESDIRIIDFRAIKDKNKVVEVEFIFDYKEDDKRILRQSKKQETIIKKIKQLIDNELIGKDIVMYPIDKCKKNINGSDYKHFRIDFTSLDVDKCVLFVNCVSLGGRINIMIKDFKSYQNLLDFRKKFVDFKETDEMFLAHIWERYEHNQEKERELNEQIRKIIELKHKRKEKESEQTLFSNDIK